VITSQIEIPRDLLRLQWDPARLDLDKTTPAPLSSFDDYGTIRDVGPLITVLSLKRSSVKVETVPFGTFIPDSSP
jgi:hypothetical protein